MFMNKCLLILFSLLSFSLMSQVTYEHYNPDGIYSFLDEMANDKIITLNDAIKPYSRIYIAEKLKAAEEKKSGLNKRQKQELEFYLYMYAFEIDPGNNIYSGRKTDLVRKNKNLALSLYPIGGFYAKNHMNVSVQPILGVSYYSNESGNVRHTWGGFTINANIGKHFGVYGSVRDNYITQVLAFPDYFTLMEGGNYKINEAGREGGDWSEARAGLTYNWKWGSIGVIKDHITWGTNYHGSNIFSGRTPSFPMIKLNMSPFKWLDFDYYHGWLISEVIDSTRSYYTSNGDYRAIYRNKYIAANMITFSPWKNLNISLGNSIIYSDVNVQLAYLIPFLFFKSVDHTINHGIDNQNSQMYLNISCRQIKHLHLYFTFFVDDFSVTRITDPGRNNITSFKGGFKVSNWLVKNFSLNFEFTHTVPVVFKHRVPSLTFASNKYNLGHYLVDNSEEFYVSIEYRPFARFLTKAEWVYAFHGNDYQYLDGHDAERYPILKDKTWDQKMIGFSVTWQYMLNSYVFINYQISDINGYDVDDKPASFYLNKFTPEFYQGQKNTISFGVNYGF